MNTLYEFDELKHNFHTYYYREHGATHSNKHKGVKDIKRTREGQKISDAKQPR